MNKYVVIILLGLFFSCEKANDKKEKLLFLNHNISFNQQVADLISDYCKKHQDAKSFAVFIDKKQDSFRGSLSMFIITMVYSNVKILPNEINCSMYTFVNDTTPVFIFTGVEDFVNTNSHTISNMEYRKLLAWQNSLSFIQTQDTSFYVEGDNFPFMNGMLRPTVIFKIPENDLTTD
jgi:hypothetical protein